MANVYDAIAAFYNNDPGWDQVLARTDAEAYFRHLAWQGSTDAAMQHQWNQLLMLCIYAENGEINLYEMTEDDIVDLVAWCGRNVVDFQVSCESVRDFLDTLGSFYLFLKQEGRIASALAPRLAAQLLLRDDGTLGIIDQYGDYLPGEEDREARSAPPPEGQVFLNAWEAVRGIMEELRRFYQKEEFDGDFQRALTLYEQALGMLDLENDPGEDFWQGFWDYFLMDYHLTGNDLTPLEMFRQWGDTDHPQMVNELSTGFLALFTVEDMMDNSRFLCRDFLTGDMYNLNFHLTGDDPVGDRVILGHVFYNRSMGMNCLQSRTLRPLARKRLRELLEECLRWYDVQCPGADWPQFMARHGLVCRSLLLKMARNPAACRFPYETRQQGYIPGPLAEDMDMVECLAQEILLVGDRGQNDVRLVRHMWEDFREGYPALDQYEPQVWAAALVENFLEINEKRAARKLPFLAEIGGVPHRDLTRAYTEIRDRLQLEPSDPRYLNEMGFLMMFSRYA
jgi:hypothetical protein